MINPRDLWFNDTTPCTHRPQYGDCRCESPGWAPFLRRTTLRGSGRTVVTDGFVMLYTSELINPTQIPTPAEMPEHHMLRVMHMLTRPAKTNVTERWFAKKFIDPIERAGYDIRELEGENDAHGVIGADGRVFGAIMPTQIGTNGEPDTTWMRQTRR